MKRANEFLEHLKNIKNKCGYLDYGLHLAYLLSIKEISVKTSQSKNKIFCPC